MVPAEEKTIKLFERITKAYGLDSLIGKIMAILYLEPEPVSLEGLAKRTGYSLASICNKVKKLEMFAPIIRIKKPGSKKVYVTIEKDMGNILKSQMEKHKEKKINPLKNKLPGIIKEFKNQAKTDNDKKKVKILQNYYKDVLKFDKIMTKTLKELEK